MPDPLTTAQRITLAEAIAAAASRLGITPPELRDITRSGHDAELLLIRCERALVALTGGDTAAARHWMRTRNSGTGGVPVEQVRSAAGLAEVVAYIEALAGAGR